MKEVKSPQRPLLYYYLIALGVILLFNMLVMPVMSMNQVLEVDYGTFVQMAEDKNLGQVEVDETENQILFTDKDQTTIYKAGMIPDPDLARLLKDSGAKYGGQIIEQTNPILSFLLSWVLPIAIFIFLGQYMSKKLMEQAGGKNSLSFGMGKSNAKVYVQSTKGIRFSDVAGEDEAKESLQEIVDYLHDPTKYTQAGAAMPKASCWWALQAPVKPCWLRQWLGKPTYPSSPFQVLSLWRCSWAWALPRCGICLSRPRKRRRVSYSSMKSTPLAKNETPAAMGATMSGSKP